jgi:glycosyltransferase involved in cell wall biosynthesis
LQLAILIPTFRRPRELERLVRILAGDAEVVARRLPVLVSDNASSDETPALVRALAAELPQLDLRLHVQSSNVGAVANMRWLIENAPACDYLWVLGDDDYPTEGTVGAVLETITACRPQLIHIPARWETEDGEVRATSPCPADIETFASARDLLLAEYYLHFISSGVVRRTALLEALSLAPTSNEWAPHIWFGLAARGGPSVVLPRIGIVGAVGITWQDRLVPVLTRDLLATYADGFHLVLDEDGFAAMLDVRHPPGGSCDEIWLTAPLDDLRSAVRQFPASRQLRRLLVTRAERQVLEGEAMYMRGDSHEALQRLESALECDPTNAGGWCSLGVVRHALGQPGARDAFERALAIDPAHPEALQSRALLAAAGTYA